MRDVAFLLRTDVCARLAACHPSVRAIALSVRLREMQLNAAASCAAFVRCLQMPNCFKAPQLNNTLCVTRY